MAADILAFAQHGLIASHSVFLLLQALLCSVQLLFTGVQPFLGGHHFLRGRAGLLLLFSQRLFQCRLLLGQRIPRGGSLLQCLCGLLCLCGQRLQLLL